MYVYMYKTFYSVLFHVHIYSMVKSCEKVESDFVEDLSEVLKITTEISPECKL